MKLVSDTGECVMGMREMKDGQVGVITEGEYEGEIVQRYDIGGPGGVDCAWIVLGQPYSGSFRSEWSFGPEWPVRILRHGELIEV